MNRKAKAILGIAVAGAVSIPCWLPMAMPKREKIPMDYHSQVEFVGTGGISENSRIIAELQHCVDILDRKVNEALKRARYRIRIHRFVPVVVTAYNPVEVQTGSSPQITASSKQVRTGMVAMSRDLEEEFGFRFGDPVFIVGLDFLVFEDRMNKRWTRQVDILMPGRKVANGFGVKYWFGVWGTSINK